MTKLHYHEAIELGFKRHEEPDEIFEKQHGYPYFIVSRIIDKNNLVEWDIETHELKLYTRHMLQRTISKEELFKLISEKS